MAVKKSECRNIKEEPNTPGGTTYHVILPNEKEQRPICFRRVHDNNHTRCANTAGKGTWHVGTGACNCHGGNAGRKPTTGRYAIRARQRLADSIGKYMAKDKEKLMDLSLELATIRALFEEFLEIFPDPKDKRYGIELNRAISMIQATGSLVEKISKIESRNTLTAAQVLYLRATVADILMKYIPELPQRELAMQELTHRVGGYVEG